MRIQGQSTPGKGGRYKARESGLRLAFLLEERRLSWSEPPWEEGMEGHRVVGPYFCTASKFARDSESIFAFHSAHFILEFANPPHGTRGGH